MGNAHPPNWAVSCIENGDQDRYYFPEEEGESEYIQIIWEFQRYREGVGWGAGDNFFPDDPGRFSSFDRKIFGNSIQSVEPDIPHGFKVDLGWTVVFHKKVSEYKQGVGYVDQTSISDRFGWYYAKSFFSERWLEHHERGCDVRRRSWRRILAENM